MSRKDESKAKDAFVTVNVDEFSRARDKFIIGLAGLQSAVSDLSRFYLDHTNTILNRGPVLAENSLTSGLAGGFASSLFENALLGSAVAQHALGQDAGKSETGEKKKRKRAPHDPNAPKRALTPYFLYMQHNRQLIANELGPDAKPKDVADEGTVRWSNMSDEEKAVWKKLYNDNLAVYRAKMNAYKAGLPIPEDDNVKADNQLQQSVAAAEAEAEEETDSPSESESEESDESDIPAKEPTPPPSKRRRGGALKTPASPVSTKKASPEKKKQSTPPKKDTSSRKSIGGSTDGKRKSKKRKSEVGGDE
ncbi:HMG box protein, putative [Talaromyces stipitatus ATCC 10500]|uniref:HMG box protein, putative n=1 Tax=Talaromyces stipitatus (strain ATCC 10500 / CBS 375.48 / QM 6759 / NRRL 1006) TaxID=441959 RepID=B8MGP9_TALSN|nr:HMG box protein, putative [Talaromyces stipitatus ATCC 10500]EED16800.1 HMG box protein, putative [Talaromyces stipitatus ATCC 10500]